jgi:hypothetical protein
MATEVSENLSNYTHKAKLCIWSMISQESFKRRIRLGKRIDQKTLAENPSTVQRCNGLHVWSVDAYGLAGRRFGELVIH